jgi:hypothetical protein
MILIAHHSSPLKSLGEAMGLEKVIQAARRKEIVCLSRHSAEYHRRIR